MQMLETGSANPVWTGLAEPLARELAWCLFSSPIFFHSEPGAWDRPGLTPGAATNSASQFNDLYLDNESHNLLASVNRDPEPLRRHLQQSADRRLGARFESFWTFFFAAHPGYQLLAHNLPIRTPHNIPGKGTAGKGAAGKRTLGELDLLYQDRRRNAVVHAEIAAKFYLSVPDRLLPDRREQHLYRLIGPDPEDSLGAKIEHMLNRQLPLSGSIEAKTGLRLAGLPPVDCRTALISGYLFLPLQDRIRPVPEANAVSHLPTAVNTGCNLGLWLYRRELPGLLALNRRRQWWLLEKRHWLQPLPSGAPTAPEALLHTVIRTLQREGRPLMLGCSNAAVPGGFERLFVVPDDWPWLAGTEV